MNKVKLIAFADPSAPKKVKIVAAPDADRDGKDGVRHFIVLNGAWTGSFKDDTVTVGGVGTKFPAVLVWEGYGNSKDYNSIIADIEREIANR